jgi:hypothetical protein
VTASARILLLDTVDTRLCHRSGKETNRLSYYPFLSLHSLSFSLSTIFFLLRCKSRNEKTKRSSRKVSHSVRLSFPPLLRGQFEMPLELQLQPPPISLSLSLSLPWPNVRIRHWLGLPPLAAARSAVCSSSFSSLFSLLSARSPLFLIGKLSREIGFAAASSSSSYRTD